MAAETPRVPLLRASRFLPLFVTQFLGALNDNLFKNALGVMALFESQRYGDELVAIGLGVFILPYALFSSLAGELADRSDKARLVRATKIWELGLMAVGAAGFLTGNLALLMAVLFGLGVQATFFGPLKYGILPDHLAERELVAGNGLIEAGTFVGILLGTSAGSALVRAPHGPEIVAAAGLVVALAGLASAWRVPPAPSVAPGLKIGWNIFGETLALVRSARQQRDIWLCVLGISWFWAVGAVVVSELPVVAKQSLGGDAPLITLLLAVFSVGVGAGSIGCARLLHGEVTPRLVPFAALGISLFCGDLSFALAAAGPLPRPWDVLAAPAGWRILLDLFVLAMCGGVFSVSLYAFIQDRAAPGERSRMIAVNNVVNAVFMVAASAIAAGLAFAQMPAWRILLLTALANFVVALWILRILPQTTLRAVARWYFRRFHRAEVSGLEHWQAAGERVVVVVNHLSLADGALVAAFLPDAPAFAVYTGMARKWWVRLLMAPVESFVVDSANPLAARAMINWVRGNRKLAIFPEGRITRTGALMKIYEGAAMVADHAGATILPIRIDGLQFSRMARMEGGASRWFPPVRMVVSPPVRLTVDATLFGRARRHALGTALHALMVRGALAGARIDQPLFTALMTAADRHGRGRMIAEDVARKPISYRRLLLGALVLGRRLDALVPRAERIGLLLPNSNAALLTLFGAQAFARVPALLNFSAGTDGLLSACATAEIGSIVTSRDFVRRGRLERSIAALQEGRRILYLEDIRGGIGWRARLLGAWDLRRVDALPGSRVAAEAPAVVLFTSGSEGTPKGVVVSHRNILANCAQLAAVLDFGPADRVVNAMPMFHAFGLTGGSILPMLAGVPTFFYPSPLHYRIVPETIYDTDATIGFGTDTFLAGWARYAHPYDFHAVRVIYAGAEKLRAETRQIYAERFGVRVLEGYGVTEAAPVVALNTPMDQRVGTVGRLLPGIEHRLVVVEGIAEGGRLEVRGPNVMLGYLRATAPGVLEPPPEGWFDTGDIVSIDAAGFLTIVGRVKRFAKIGGEMVSMVAAEELAASLWPDAKHAVVARPDPRRGERLVLVTTQRGAEPSALQAHAATRRVGEILLPRSIVVVEALPLLGSGKTDYPALQRLLEARAAA